MEAEIAVGVRKPGARLSVCGVAEEPNGSRVDIGGEDDESGEDTDVERAGRRRSRASRARRSGERRVWVAAVDVEERNVWRAVVMGRREGRGRTSS